MLVARAVTFAATLLAGCSSIEQMRDLAREEPWRMYQTPTQRFTNFYDDNRRNADRQLYLKDYDAALASYRQAYEAAQRLEAEQKKRGNDVRSAWPQMSTALRGMANAHDGRREFLQAEALYKQALALREGVWGPDNLPVANVVADLGNNLRRQKRYDEALPALERTAAIYERHDLPHDYALVLGDIGKVYADQGRLAQAESYSKRALDTTELAMKRFHRYPEALATQQIVHLKAHANAVRRSGRAAEAEQLDARTDELVRALRQRIASLRAEGGRDDYAGWIETRLGDALSD